MGKLCSVPRPLLLAGRLLLLHLPLQVPLRTEASPQWSNDKAGVWLRPCQSIMNDTRVQTMREM
jgi:hypothetical protein